jgi:regulator of protease activity HflC (stomatin/prohibitin superfamily)
MRIVVAGLVGVAGLTVAGVGPARAQVPERLVACASKVADAERLACYDAVVGSMNAEARRASEAREAEAKVAAAAAAAAAATAAEAAAAKAEADRQAGFGKAASAAESVAEIQAAITEVLRDSSGKSVFVLDNGQIWRQADGFNLPGVKVGTSVTVKRGALGSFRLVPASSNRSVLVIRMR